MPSLLRNDMRPVYDAKRRMFGTWMRVAVRAGDPSGGHVEGVRVLVTLESLWNLEPNLARTVDAARAIFDLYANHIDIRAGTHFAVHGAVPGEFYRGRPVIVLTTVDLDFMHKPWF